MFALKLKDSVSSLSSLVTTVERTQVDEGEYFSSTSEITTIEDKTETIVEKRKTKEEQVWSLPEIPLPQTIIEREDNWFELLDVIPKETPYVPPGAVKIPCAAFQNNFSSLMLCSVLSGCVEDVKVTACVERLSPVFAHIISYAEGKRPGGGRKFCLCG